MHILPCSKLENKLSSVYSWTMTDIAPEMPKVTGATTAKAPERLDSAEAIAHAAEPVIRAFEKHGVHAWAIYGSAIFALDRYARATQENTTPVYDLATDIASDVDFVIAEEEIEKVNIALREEGLLVSEIGSNPSEKYASAANGKSAIGDITAGFRVREEGQEVELMGLNADGSPRMEGAIIEQVTVDGITIKYIDLVSHAFKYAGVTDKKKDPATSKARAALIDERYRTEFLHQRRN